MCVSARCSSGGLRKQILNRSFHPKLVYMGSLFHTLLLLPSLNFLSPDFYSATSSTSDFYSATIKAIWAVFILNSQVNNIFSFAGWRTSYNQEGLVQKRSPGQRTHGSKAIWRPHKEFWLSHHHSQAPEPGAVQLGPQETDLERDSALLSDP